MQSVDPTPEDMWLPVAGEEENRGDTKSTTSHRASVGSSPKLRRISSSKHDDFHTLNLDDLERILEDRGLIKELRSSLNLIAVPLLIIATLAVGFLLKWAENILVPFVVAVFFTYLLRPIVNCLSRPLGECHKANCARNTLNAKNDVELTGLLNQDDRYDNGKTKPEDSLDSKSNSRRCTACIRCRVAKVPRWLAVALSMVWVIGVCTGLILLIADAIQSFEENHLEEYENRTKELLDHILNWLKRNLNVDGTYINEQLQGQIEFVQVTKSLLLSVMDGVAYTFVVFLFMLYMLFEEPDSRNGTPNSASYNRVAGLRREMDAQIQRYLVVKTVISAAVGLLVYIVLGPILNVKMAHLFGVITFLANFIPNVGAIVSTLIPFPVVILDPTQTTMSMMLAFTIPVMIHAIVGNVVEPKVFGDQMELHPVVVMLSLSFWFAVWGIPGAILSVPITAVIRIIVSNIAHPYTNFALRLLEGKLPGSTEFHMS